VCVTSRSFDVRQAAPVCDPKRKSAQANELRESRRSRFELTSLLRRGADLPQCVRLSEGLSTRARKLQTKADPLVVEHTVVIKREPDEYVGHGELSRFACKVCL
jgi:hypothetical protein